MGINEQLTGSNEHLTVWPNPSADGRFTLSSLTPGPSPKGEGRLTVSDALGRVVWQQTKADAAETVVDLSASAAGLYVLRVQWADGRQVVRKLLRE